MTKKQEALNLSNKILKELEHNKGELQEQLFKALHVCSLIDDKTGMKVFKFETCGYDLKEDGQLTKESWEAIKLVGRVYFKRKTDKIIKCAEVRLVSELIAENKILKEKTNDTLEPQSYGDHITPFMINTTKNSDERVAVTEKLKYNNNFINAVRGFLYNYMLNIYTVLRYGSVPQTIFENIKNDVDSKIAEFCPENTKKFLSIYENLMSNNDEDWANAVNTCRRVIIELADKLYPASKTSIYNDEKEIKLNRENYKNRLIQYIESKKGSKTYKAIVGSEIDYIKNVLNALVDGLNKGTHNLCTKYQAERIVIYTYMLIGDILNL